MMCDGTSLSLSEGWGVFDVGDGRLEIQRVDDPGYGYGSEFESDEAALAFVQKRASEGSFRHWSALVMTGPHAQKEAAPSPVNPETTETTMSETTMTPETSTLIARWADIKATRMSLASQEAAFASDLAHALTLPGHNGPELETAWHVYRLSADNKVGGLKVLRAAFGLSLRDALLLWEMAEFHAKRIAEAESAS